MPRVDELFDVQYGHSLELNRLELTAPADGIRFISRKMRDNGIAAYVRRLSDVEPNPGGQLTCALSGNGVLSTFIQEQPYYTAFHVACLTPKFDLTTAQLLYYCQCIRANRYRYSYGRQANRTLAQLELPGPTEIPRYVDCIDVERYSGADAPRTESPTPPLGVTFWQPVQLASLFDIRKGKRLTRAHMLPGAVPFIGAIDRNNGVAATVGQAALHEGNTITVNYNGSVAEAFYQPVPFGCSDDVNVLYPRFDMTPAVALFFATLIRHEKYRFNYARKWHLERMAKSTLRLPVKASGDLDLAFMENYIAMLPFSSVLEG